MKITRTQEKDNFVWYEFTYNGQNLLHWDLKALVDDIYNLFQVDLKPYLFNYNSN